MINSASLGLLFVPLSKLSFTRYFCLHGNLRSMSGYSFGITNLSSPKVRSRVDSHDSREGLSGSKVINYEIRSGWSLGASFQRPWQWMKGLWERPLFASGDTGRSKLVSMRSIWLPLEEEPEGWSGQLFGMLREGEMGPCVTLIKKNGLDKVSVV